MNYIDTINDIEKQVNDFSKYIKKEDIVLPTTNTLNTYNTYNKKNDSIVKKIDIKYLIIPISLFLILCYFKPKFIISTKIIKNEKKIKINYTRVLLLSIFISAIVVYFLNKKK